jgi:signal transduction histidine kinase
VLPGKDGKRFFVFNWFPIRYREGSAPLTGAVAIDITDRRQAEQELIAYQEKLRALSANASATEERERRQIAAALHDQIGSTLAAAQIRLQLLEATLDESSREEFAAGARQALPDVVGDLEQAIAHTRSLTCELSPPLLYEAGLEAAVRWLGDQLFHRHGLRIRVEGDGSIETLAQELKVAIYQGVRELLTNVVKHANASEAVVRITKDGEQFVVAVIDDGVGLSTSVSRRNNSFGLFNLRERMNYLGGSLEFESVPGRGTRAIITLNPHRELEAGATSMETEIP